MRIKAAVLFTALGLTMGSSYLGLKMNRDHQRAIGKKIGQLHEQGLVSPEVRDILQDAKNTAKLNYKVSLWPTLVFWFIAVVMCAAILRDAALLRRRQDTPDLPTANEPPAESSY